jgi:hypothetical protein
MTANLVLAFDIPIGALYSRDALAAPDVAVAQGDSDLIVDLAPALDDFLADLFGVATEVDARRARDRALAPLYAVKRLFAQRRAAKKIDAKQAEASHRNSCCQIEASFQ